MKVSSLIAFVTGLANASINVNDGTISQRDRFEAWIKQYKMTLTFGDKNDGFKKAWSAWAANDKIIQEVNAKSLSYKLGHNHFSHMTSEEFASAYGRGGLSKSHMRKGNETVDWTLVDPVRQEAAPPSVDWVARGAVTRPKQQGVCGSCWAFSTTGAIESAFRIAGYNLTAFSEDQLVECDKNDKACNGGHYIRAFKYVKSQGLCTESDYPYGAATLLHGIVGSCQHSCKPVVTISGWNDVPSYDEDALKVAVSQQPVNVAVDGENSHWQFYKEGVMDNRICTDNVDHAVLAVGYGTDNSTDYWKIKNSWGANWGEAGYIRLTRDTNTCGVAKMPSYPTGVVSIPYDSHHYGDPTKHGCLSDENIFKLRVIPGEICSPSCANSSCSRDLQPGMSGNPTCETSTKQCILTCSNSSQCGKATCHPIPGFSVGLCTYNSFSHHYGDPTKGSCLSDEIAFELPNIPGKICSPFCANGKCSKDLPPGVSANPLCEMKTQQCLLTCTSSSQCGTATCRVLPGLPVGLCTYDQGVLKESPLYDFNVDELSFNQSTSVILK